MRFDTETYDRIARRVVGNNPNMLAPWWLMSAFMYEVENDPFLSDACFDWLSGELLAKWDQVEHRHKHLIDREALRAGTGLAADLRNLPTIIKHAAQHLVADYANAAEIGRPQAVQMLSVPNIDDLLGLVETAKTEINAATGIDDLLGVSAGGIEDLL